jgi:hypothetical protein
MQAREGWMGCVRPRQAERLQVRPYGSNDKG